MARLSEVEAYIANASESEARLIRKWAHKRYITFKKTKVLARKYSPESMEAAIDLFARCNENFPNIKDPNLEDWAEDIDKLNRIDKQPWELIRPIIVWSQQDKFWRQQIRSGGALRRHFEKLCIQAKSQIDTKKGKVYSV